MSGASARNGLLVSIEGINGVGKDYLLERLRPQLVRPSHTIAEFSARIRAEGSPDLSQQILRAMKNASGSDHFLRAGAPRSETLLLFAVKTHDYEQARRHLDNGDTVLEGRSLHSTAVYQALILKPGRPLDTARSLLTLGAMWRPMPDLTIFVTDDVDTSLQRAEERDGMRFTSDERALHHQADTLFRELAADHDQSRVLDRRALTVDAAASRMARWINEASRKVEAPHMPRPRGACAANERVSP